MKKDNVFWGVILILAAVYIIINSLGFMPDVSGGDLRSCIF